MEHQDEGPLRLYCVILLQQRPRDSVWAHCTQKGGLRPGCLTGSRNRFVTLFKFHSNDPQKIHLSPLPGAPRQMAAEASRKSAKTIQRIYVRMC